MGNELREPTGDPEADRVLVGLLGVAECVAPGWFRAAYLVGSFADGSAVWGSDLDVLLIFGTSPDEGQRGALRRLFRHCGRLSPIPLDVRAVELEAVGRAGPVLASARLLAGDDVRGRVPAASREGVRRETRLAALAEVGRLYPDGLPTTRPLPPPDPDGAFLGFDGRPTRRRDGGEAPGTRGPVAALTWAARSALLDRGGPWVSGKGEPLADAAERHLGADWTAALRGAFGRCRGEWGYLVPDARADRAWLREWCRATACILGDWLSACEAGAADFR